MENELFQIRHKFRNDLKKIHSFYKEEINLNSINILFPHTWLLEPTRDHPKYKQKIKSNEQIRVRILKRVCQFVETTKRFKDDEYGI